MRSVIYRYPPWIILIASFAILAVFYNSLPPEIILVRGFFGSPDTLASRSIFTVFRVPLIDTICAAAAAILYRKFLRTLPDLARFWLILLYTAAVKSLLQVMEILSAPDIAKIFFYLTLAVVVGGIVVAFLFSHRHLNGFIRGLGRFNAFESIFLAVLLIGYLVVAIIPGFVYK